MVAETSVAGEYRTAAAVCESVSVSVCECDNTSH